jgi:hypothetical protein
MYLCGGFEFRWDNKKVQSREFESRRVHPDSLISTRTGLDSENASCISRVSAEIFGDVDLIIR